MQVRYGSFGCTHLKAVLSNVAAVPRHLGLHQLLTVAHLFEKIPFILSLESAERSDEEGRAEHSIDTKKPSASSLALMLARMAPGHSAALVTPIYTPNDST